ncbi:MAG TPA: hypothetical protein VN372_10085, partial [Methanospirillum sp.]|nr:hypothetical protein [Methanospirillum sp.]
MVSKATNSNVFADISLTPFLNSGGVTFLEIKYAATVLTVASFGSVLYSDFQVKSELILVSGSANVGLGPHHNPPLFTYTTTLYSSGVTFSTTPETEESVISVILSDGVTATELFSTSTDKVSFELGSAETLPRQATSKAEQSKIIRQQRFRATYDSSSYYHIRVIIVVVYAKFP